MLKSFHLFSIMRTTEWNNLTTPSQVEQMQDLKEKRERHRKFSLMSIYYCVLKICGLYIVVQAALYFSCSRTVIWNFENVVKQKGVHGTIKSIKKRVKSMFNRWREYKKKQTVIHLSKGQNLNQFKVMWSSNCASHLMNICDKNDQQYFQRQISIKVSLKFPHITLSISFSWNLQSSSTIKLQKFFSMGRHRL